MFFIKIKEESNLNLNIPVYLVSLEKDYIRRMKLKQYINFNYFVGVDGSKLDLDKFPNSPLRKGEIGCYLSHIHLLNYAIKNKGDRTLALILEDDAKITNRNIENIIYDVINKLPNDWEILFLGHNYYELNNNNIEHFNTYNISNVHGTHGYLINLENINEDKINKMFPIMIPYDVKLPQIFNCFVIEPKLIELSEDSTVSNTQNIL